MFVSQVPGHSIYVILCEFMSNAFNREEKKLLFLASNCTSRDRTSWCLVGDTKN